MFGFLKKRDYTATLLPAATSLTVHGGEKLLNAALAAGLDWPHDCRVGSCGTCRCRLRGGQVKRLTDFSYTLSPAEIADGAILACQSLLKSDITVEIELGSAARAGVVSRCGRIARTRYLTHDIQEVTLALVDGAIGPARAGQYADLRLSQLDAARSYSFARAPAATAGAELCFFIRHVPGGGFTDWLFAAERSGAELELSGPYGNFYLRPGGGRLICVAGGSGLAPIYAMLEAAAREQLARAVSVLFGARTQADLYYLAELAALARDWHGDFEIIPVLSAEPADSAWRGARGFVTDELARRFAAGLAEGAQGYLCGPPPMVDAGLATLRELGLGEDALFYDKFLDASTQPGGRAAI